MSSVVVEIISLLVSSITRAQSEDAPTVRANSKNHSFIHSFIRLHILSHHVATDALGAIAPPTHRHRNTTLTPLVSRARRPSPSLAFARIKRAWK